MAMISGDKDIDMFLEMLLRNMQKAGAISPEQKKDIKAVLGPAMKQAGGFNPDEPNAINKLKQGIVAVALCNRVGNDPKLSMQNFATLQKEQANLVSLVFKDSKKQTPEEKRKFSMAMAYLLVLEQKPDANISLALAMKDPKTLTPQEKKKLGEDIVAVFETLSQDPNFKMDPTALAGLLEMVKKEIQDPGISKGKGTPEEDKLMTQNLTNLFGIDPHVPGKITGPIMVMAGNMMGIAENYPVFGDDPLNSYSGARLNASMQSATGVYQLAEDRDKDLGANAAAPEQPEAPAPESAAKSDAGDSLLSAVASAAEDAVSEMASPAKEVPTVETPKQEAAEEWKPKSPFEIKGPKPPGAPAA
jgi:hypothetical protein